MNRNKLQAMRRHARKVQQIVYETRECINSECDNCDCAYICELTNCLINFIQHELYRYDVKGELKDDND